MFDTSSKVSATTVLVDTPGLSSGDPRHLQALVEFLPQTDGAILVVDINAQVTRTLVDFVNTMKLANRPVYLVITKVDTKSAAEVEQTKALIAGSCKLDVQQVACVAAPLGNLDEFYQLMGAIEKDKRALIEKADGLRLKSLVGQMLEQIALLEKSAGPDQNVEDALRKQESKLRHINQNITRFVESSGAELERLSQDAESQFRRNTSTRLYDIVSGKKTDYEAEAAAAVNSLAAISINQYRNDVRYFLLGKANERVGGDAAVSFQSLENVDLENLQSEMHCQFNLNALGHEHDKTIAMAGKGAAVVAAVVATAGAVAAAAGGAATAAAGGMSVGEAVLEGGEIAMLLRQRQKVKALQKDACQEKGWKEKRRRRAGGSGRRGRRQAKRQAERPFPEIWRKVEQVRAAGSDHRAKGRHGGRNCPVHGRLFHGQGLGKAAEAARDFRLHEG